MYIVVMYYNSRIEKWANTLNIPFKKASREERSSLFAMKVTNVSTSDGATNPVDKTLLPVTSDNEQGIRIKYSCQIYYYLWLFLINLLTRGSGTFK